jgi:very-short-patch-repair endonuclease
MPSKNRPQKLPYNTLIKERAQNLRIQPTPAEKYFWNSLRAPLKIAHKVDECFKMVVLQVFI